MIFETSLFAKNQLTLLRFRIENCCCSHFIWKIYLHFRLALPKIATFSFGDEPLNFGESASAQCTISGGDLPMDVKWMLNGMEIPSYLEVSTSKIGKRINVLSIDSVKADHKGNYSCIVSNLAGTAEFTAPLVVIGSFSQTSKSHKITQNHSCIFWFLMFECDDRL